MVDNREARIAQLEAALAASQQREAELAAERDEAVEHQTATAAILRVIASSPTDRQVALQSIVDTASRLCSAPTVDMYQVIGDTYQGVAAAGLRADPAVQTEWRRIRDGRLLTREAISGRAMLDRKTVYVSDILACGEEYPESFRGMTRIGMRVQVSVPLLSGDRTLGTLNLYDSCPDAFTTNQIRLLETFANQAVIAIENARLFSELELRNAELSSALDQQTATAEVLRVIASSPTDLATVLQAIVESAAGLCQVDSVGIFRVDGDTLLKVANLERQPGALVPGNRVPLRDSHMSGRAVLRKQTTHFHDLEAVIDQEYPEAAAGYWQNQARLGAEAYRPRTVLIVPLMRDDVAIGALNVSRTEVRPFIEAEIALLEGRPTTGSDECARQRGELPSG